MGWTMKLLMATYNFPPESYGGTEVYVELLARELMRRGHSVEVLCGGKEALGASAERFALQQDSYQDLPVWRLRLAGERFTLPELYTTRAADLEQFWSAWLREHRPDLLHMNGHSLTASGSLMAAARNVGIPVMFTLHNAPTFCPRGDYITYRGVVCDGQIELGKCTECVLATRSGNVVLGRAAGALSPILSRLPVPARSGGSRVRTGFFLPALLRAKIEAMVSTTADVSLWHVFSQWTRNALELNGVPAAHIQLLRHPLPGVVRETRKKRHEPGKLRLGFFGRFNHVKGLEVLLDAVELLPGAPLLLDVFGAAQDSAEEVLERRLTSLAARDPRVRPRGRVNRGEVSAALAALDAMVVPSLWVETGPLTVLEAFASGVPVVGSDLSGINEWVQDGRNGLLFPHGDARALASCISRLIDESGLLDRLQDFPAMQSVEEHCDAVLDLYRKAGRLGG
jgi:glycosyltransferase involved in cell wall biosynthesis